ncbi:hypothetical protein FH972_022684 [Carpinus fangiana]|uniref:Uncharacterized protein n=1 Tax=Carpinus fangiana TaxID=176857 RepID=A0A5N6KT98_9ROSI|nr:hypothetical protein FH972_022684 [Carpinus fangiana]
MHRTANAASRGIHGQAQRPHRAVWVTDDLLADTYSRFLLSSKTFRRHGTNVPGPLEHRKRAASRRMNHLSLRASDPFDSIPPLPNLRNAVGALLKRTVDEWAWFWRNDQSVWQAPSAIPCPTAPIGSEWKKQRSVSMTLVEYKQELQGKVKCLADLRRLHWDLGSAQLDTSICSAAGLKHLLAQAGFTASEAIEFLNDPSLNLHPAHNLLLAFETFAQPGLHLADFRALAEHLISAFNYSQLTPGQAFVALHSLARVQDLTVDGPSSALRSVDKLWDQMWTGLFRQHDNSSTNLIQLLLKPLRSDVVDVSLEQDSADPKLHPLQVVAEGKEMSEMHWRLLPTFTKAAILHRPDDIKQILPSLPASFVARWGHTVIQNLNTDSPDGDVKLARQTLTTWLSLLHGRLAVEWTLDEPEWVQIYHSVSKICEPGDIMEHFGLFNTRDTARVIWRSFIHRGRNFLSIPTNIVEEVDASLVATRDDLVWAPNYRHLAPFLNLVVLAAQRFPDDTHIRGMILRLFHARGKWKEFAWFARAMRSNYQMELPLEPLISFMSQCPEEDGKAAAQVYMLEGRVGLQDVPGLLEKLIACQEVHPTHLQGILQKRCKSPGIYRPCMDKIGEAEDKRSRTSKGKRLLTAWIRSSSIIGVH